MGVHVEWASATGTSVEVVHPHEDWADSYGTRIDPAKLGLCLGGDDVVMIEGTREELLGLVERMRVAVEAADEDCPPCADGEHATVENHVCTCCRARVEEYHAVVGSDEDLEAWCVFPIDVEDPDWFDDRIAGPFPTLADAERWIERH